MKGLTLFNYAGSGTIGAMNAGIDMDLVLEISDEMINLGAAKHYKYNYPDKQIISPSIWDDDTYLYNLSKEDYDILIGWPPCSGLSQINRNANPNNSINQYLYKYFNTVSKIKPKTFILENAPTLLTTGKPILNELVKTLNNDYRFTIIRDYAGNHNVCMKRQRTLVVGWRRDIFNYIPKIKQEHKIASVLDIISSTPKDDPMNILVPERTCKDLDWVLPDLESDISICSFIAKNYDKYKDKLTDSNRKTILTIRDKMINNKRIFDKSPCRPKSNSFVASLASVVEIIHPIENRPLTIREYLRIMGFPDSYNLDLSNKTPIIQCIAQGVPSKFMQWIVSQVKYNLEHIDNVDYDYDDIRYQHLSTNIESSKAYKIEGFINYNREEV